MEKVNGKALEAIDRIVAKHKDQMGPVKLMLHDCQHELGYIPAEAMEKIALACNVSMAEVYGVVTFYTQFTTEPKGKYVVSICMGTACYVRNSQKLLDMVCQVTGCDVNATTADKKFSVDATRCLGACGLAPVAVVNNQVFGAALDNDNLKNYLKELVAE